MAKCAVCDGPEHPAWKAHTFKRNGVASKQVVVIDRKVFVTAKPDRKAKRNPAGGFDRVKYQREYMRKWRKK